MNVRSGDFVVARKTESKKSRLEAWLELRKPAVVDPALRDEVAGALGPVSSGYLRELLRASGVRLHPLVEGVRQDTLENLERTLTDLAGIYEHAKANSDRVLERECRILVIQAKDHARITSRRTKSPQKEEVVRWTLVWLENPQIFVEWARLRRRALEQNLRDGTP
jgi:hypothetical protein